jgi:hypothetical protein
VTGRFLRSMREKAGQLLGSSEAEAKAVMDALLHDRRRRDDLKKELTEALYWQQQYSNVLDTMTNAMEALVWRKDTENRYLLASPLHCQKFFGISTTTDCLASITGKTDTELIQAIFLDHGMQNTFGEICAISDNYAQSQRKVCHFLEAGLVEGEQVLLYVVKTPQFEQGACIGTVGMAWDFSQQSDFMVRMLNRWIYADKAVSLHQGANVFAYLITPEAQQCDIFKHVCPTPHNIRCDGLSGTNTKEG